MVTCDQPPETVVEVRGLSKRFGTTTVLNNISLQIRRGEFLSLLGWTDAEVSEKNEQYDTADNPRQDDGHEDQVQHDALAPEIVAKCQSH